MAQTVCDKMRRNKHTDRECNQYNKQDGYRYYGEDESN
jgi:hypothetical protein